MSGLLLDREAAIVALMRAFEEAGERDRRALDGLGWVGIPPVPGDVLRQHCANVVDLVVPQARPMPTREQIERGVTDALILSDDLVAPGFSARIEADADDIAVVVATAVLALLNGAGS